MCKLYALSVLIAGNAVCKMARVTLVHTVALHPASFGLAHTLRRRLLVKLNQPKALLTEAESTCFSAISHRESVIFSC